MNKLVDELLQRFVPTLREHLSDERLATLICRELPFIEAWMAERHLARCRQCRRRRWSLEGPRAQRMIEFYGEVISRPDEDNALPEKPRAEFAEWLQLAVRHAALQTREQPRKERYRLRAAIPGVSIGLAAGVIIGAITFSFSWRRVPSITANSLLVHAEKWDTSSSTASPGVAHQTVRIKTPRQSVDRSLYWDLQGKRRPRRTVLVSSEEQLKLELAPAGVDWDRPISASAYQDWHDHQHVRADSITQTGNHLLTLTTTVPDGVVSQESITIRDTDFHPVQRTVGFRNSGTVEIAELDYSVLPWGAVDASTFEPLEIIPVVGGAPLLPRPRLSLAIPESLSPEQLDETELTARLILNQLHADEGEQIEVRRSELGVEVEGLVSADDRKRELATQLMTVPRLKVSIRSEADLSANQLTSEESTSIEAATLPDNPSALETYLRHHDRPVEEINTVERQLFEGALIISKESRFIIDLKTRFTSPDQMPVVAQATLEELLYSHHERLEKALNQERMSLAQVGGMPASDAERPAPGTLLLTASEKNLALVRELTQNNVAHPRSAEEIFADMTDTLDRLFPAAREAYAGLEENRDTGKRE
jgi:hypothetical protein